MKKFNYLIAALFLLSLMVSNNFLYSKEKNKTIKPANKIAISPSPTLMNINNITSWVGANGFHEAVVGNSYNGAYPKGNTVGSIYSEGIVWGGLVYDGKDTIVRVNGNTYYTGCTPVYNNRIYRVRPDFQTAGLVEDAASFNFVEISKVTQEMINELKTQYQRDWLEWPANLGAVYQDNDNNGIYNPDPNGNGIFGETGEDIPGVPNSSQTIFGIYNDNFSDSLYGAPPIGFEVHETYWAYAFSGALSNIIYKKVDLIYKGTATSSPNSNIKDFYLAQWADPDVGNSKDDYAGCDTALNLGYAYNAFTQDNDYLSIGLAPAAIGYDFLQGISKYTGNSSDSAVFNFKMRKGYKYINPRPMSSFIYTAAGNDTWPDPMYSYSGSLQFYNLFLGKQSSSLYPSGDPFPNSIADVVPGIGTFLLTGEPVSGTGKIDGVIDSCGDRRILVINGPENLKLGDTVEAVIALVGGFGIDNKTSITAMKKNDTAAQQLFDQLFSSAQELISIPSPEVKVEQPDNEIIVNWSIENGLRDKIENFSGNGNIFEGYNVYQVSYDKIFPSLKKIATFDIINGITTILSGSDTLQNGTDSGIMRTLTITHDAIENYNLIKGRRYYFGVSSYTYNPNSDTRSTESNINIVGITFKDSLPGLVYEDTLSVTHLGQSDGYVVAVVYDPDLLTGHDYRVNFTLSNEDSLRWNLVDVVNGRELLTNQTNMTGDPSPAVDGIRVKVYDAPPNFKDFQEVANAFGPHDPTYAAFRINESGFPSSFSPDIDRPEPDPAGARWGISSGNSDGSFNYQWFRERVIRADDGRRLLPWDYEIRFISGKALSRFTTNNIIDVPFQLWNIGMGTFDDKSDDFQMIPIINDVNANELFDLDGIDHVLSNTDNDPETDWIYWYEPVDKTFGSTGYAAFLNNTDLLGGRVMGRIVLVNLNGGSVSDPSFPENVNEKMPGAGTVFRLITAKSFTVDDVFKFNSGIIADVKNNNSVKNYALFQNYPNPFNPSTTITYQIPEESMVTIKVYDILGREVTTLVNEYKKTGKYEVLFNASNLASGVYLYRVKAGKFSAAKKLILMK